MICVGRTDTWCASQNNWWHRDSKHPGTRYRRDIANLCIVHCQSVDVLRCMLAFGVVWKWNTHMPETYRMDLWFVPWDYLTISSPAVTRKTMPRDSECVIVILVSVAVCSSSYGCCCFDCCRCCCCRRHCCCCCRPTITLLLLHRHLSGILYPARRSCPVKNRLSVFKKVHRQRSLLYRHVISGTPPFTEEGPLGNCSTYTDIFLGSTKESPGDMMRLLSALYVILP